MTTTRNVGHVRASGHNATPETPIDRHLVHCLVDELPNSDLAAARLRLDELLAKHDARDRDLITRWIRPHPHRGGPADVVLAESSVPVYALIGELAVVAGDLNRAATDYGVPREAVEAAVAYYRRHRDIIDARMYTGGPATD